MSSKVNPRVSLINELSDVKLPEVGRCIPTIHFVNWRVIHLNGETRQVAAVSSV